MFTLAVRRQGRDSVGLAARDLRSSFNPAPSSATLRRVKVHQERIEVTTAPHALTDVTSEIVGVVAPSGITTGLCTVFLQHTSAGLVIQENADPAVLRDLARWIDGVAPEGAHSEHDAEGPDDMPAHVACSRAPASRSP